MYRLFCAIGRTVFPGAAVSAFLYLCLSFRLVGAATNSPPISEYLHKSWGPDTGLPGMVWGITRTKDGYLWLATQHGLVRFDGLRFTIFTPENTPGLRSAWITVLLADRADNLWVGTYDAGLAKILGGKVVRTYTTADGLSANAIRSLCEDQEGSIWVGMYDGTLSRIAVGERVSTSEPYRGRQPGMVNFIAPDDDGTVWLSDPKGVIRLKDNRITPYPIFEGGRPVEAVTLFPDGRESFWLGTRVGLYHFERGTFTRIWPKAVSNENTVWCIARANDGTLWFGTDTGLNRLQRGKLDHFGAKNSLSADKVYAIFLDDQDDVWLGTTGGFDKLSTRAINSYSVNDGLSANQVWAVTEDSHGAIWVGTDGGLNRFENGGFRAAYTTATGLPANAVYSVREGPDGSIWFATPGGLCRLWHGKLSIFVQGTGFRQTKSLA